MNITLASTSIPTPAANPAAVKSVLKNEKAARDFEALLLTPVLDSLQKTFAGDSGDSKTTGAILGVGFFSHINIGVRHIPPIYTGFAVCGGAALDRLFYAKRKWVMAMASALLLWQIVTGVVEH